MTEDQMLKDLWERVAVLERKLSRLESSDKPVNDDDEPDFSVKSPEIEWV